MYDTLTADREAAYQRIIAEQARQIEELQRRILELENPVPTDSMMELPPSDLSRYRFTCQLFHNPERPQGMALYNIKMRLRDSGQQFFFPLTEPKKLLRNFRGKHADEQIVAMAKRLKPGCWIGYLTQKKKNGTFKGTRPYFDHIVIWNQHDNTLTFYLPQYSDVLSKSHLPKKESENGSIRLWHYNP